MIEAEVEEALKTNNSTVISSLYNELKNIQENEISQMPEVVYARYLESLKKVENRK
jgi:hypothetical protein